MDKLLKKLPFFMVLLIVLLSSYAIGVIGLSDAKIANNRAISQQSTPDTKIDTFASRTSLPRVLYSASRQPKKQGVNWPLMLASNTGVLALNITLYGLPKNHLLFDSRRLAGWQDANLQFRFIHSR
ncbi:hypothetical protein LRP50_11635 [Enterovibrio sp. ZSDZ42]|uniref:Uncharacterized protein n=1 Tax=Enterovibrio gelatinilyticus TaxID=2899819 RepID=A0ABT5R0J7_9GAMM|nr:hypothetical protein [Enterovibrio sp. ZSDZ42]MDD1793783.1 hypothetical protein [Enterovibrio sp. ZSDZ42]